VAPAVALLHQRGLCRVRALRARGGSNQQYAVCSWRSVHPVVPRPTRVQACPQQRTPGAHGAAAGPVCRPPTVCRRQRDATLGGPFSSHGLGLCGPALALVQERPAPSAAESLGRGQRVHCDHAVGAGGLLARHTGLAGPRVNSASPCLPLLPLFVPLSLTQAHCPRPHFCLRLAV
jgi:hypothetical protein